MPRPRRVYLLMLGVITFAIGARMLSGNEADYPRAVYRTAFDVMPYTAWGWTFAVTGILMMTMRRQSDIARIIYTCAAIVWGVWAGCLWMEIPERAGVLQPTGYAVMSIVGAYSLHYTYRDHDERKR